MSIVKKILDLGYCGLLSTVTKEEDEAQWLANRTRGIGGSDIGAICGMSNYSSPMSVYLKKTGQFPDSLDDSAAASERMYFGNLLEPIVANEFERRTGRKVVVADGTFYNLQVPYALANVDRIVVDDEGMPYGILECKTAGEFMNSDWKEGDVPISYIYQLNWYMGITGLKMGWMAAIVGGNKFYEYEIPFNEDLWATQLAAADKFWNVNVKQLIEPDPIHVSIDTELIKDAYSDVIRNSEITLEGDTMDEMADAIIIAKAKIKELEKVIDENSNRIKSIMKSTEIGYTSSHVIKWSPRSQQRVNTDLLKANFPEVYEACKKVINYRVFTVK